MATPSEGSLPGFHEQLLKLCTDPGIWRFALRRAGHRDLAEDAIQETYYSVSRVKDPEHIRDVRAFFCRSLSHEISHQRGQQTPVPVEDTFVTAAGPGSPSPATAPPRSVEDTAIWLVLTETWLKRFRRERARLEALVAGRSANPRRYRQVIVAVTEQLLCAAASSCVSWADSNEALQAAYPAWLDEDGCDLATIYQRLSRARRDVRLLLTSIVNRADLSPLSGRAKRPGPEHHAAHNAAIGTDCCQVLPRTGSCLPVDP
jgi:DNA-directed RNA polymerase specialized sigma24 family protein